jgi:hypothetical protein
VLPVEVCSDAQGTKREDRGMALQRADLDYAGK